MCTYQQVQKFIGKQIGIWWINITKNSIDQSEKTNLIKLWKLNYTCVLRLCNLFLSSCSVSYEPNPNNVKYVADANLICIFEFCQIVLVIW